MRRWPKSVQWLQNLFNRDWERHAWFGNILDCCETYHPAPMAVQNLRGPEKSSGQKTFLRLCVGTIYALTCSLASHFRSHKSWCAYAGRCSLSLAHLPAIPKGTSPNYCALFDA